MNTITRTSQTTTQSTVAERLARFAIDEKEFPDNAIREAKRIILDQLACQVMFAVSPWSVAYLDAVKSLGAGRGAWEEALWSGTPTSTTA